MVADNRKVEDSEAKAIKDKLKKENEAGDLLFSVLGIHVLAGREEPTHLPTLLSTASICMRLCLLNSLCGYIYICILVVSFCVCFLCENTCQACQH